MEMTTASQPQVTRRPLQVRCSSQPMGLRSSLRRSHPRKKATPTTGVQKTRCHQSRKAEGGSSCQARRVFWPASTTAAANASRKPQQALPWPE